MYLCMHVCNVFYIELFFLHSMFMPSDGFYFFFYKYTIACLTRFSWGGSFVHGSLVGKEDIMKREYMSSFMVQ